MDRIGARLQDIRTGRKMSIRTLASLTGLSMRYIELIEAGDRTPSVGTVYKLSAALGVKPAEILQDEPEPDHLVGHAAP